MEGNLKEIIERVERNENEIRRIREEIERIKDTLDKLINIIRFGEGRTFKGAQQLSPIYKRVLEAISSRENKAITAWELANELGISRSRASEILNELFKRGYLVKTRVKKEVLYTLPEGVGRK